jgi:hypothetical protein
MEVGEGAAVRGAAYGAGSCWCRMFRDSNWCNVVGFYAPGAQCTLPWLCDRVGNLGDTAAAPAGVPKVLLQLLEWYLLVASGL